jgi:starch synthase
VLVATAELAPFAKLGGVADVASALSKELSRLGHDVRVVLPRYRQVDIGKYNLRPVVTGLHIPLGGQKLEATIYEGRLGDMVVYCVDCPPLYDRDGIIGFGDDDARSVFFSRALLEMLPALDFWPDVIHVHDWFAALVPNLLERVYTQGKYSEIATNLTIHNLAAQGVFGFGALVLAGLEEWGLIRVGIPGLDNVVNVMGRGIEFADVVNTVSERYATEMQTPEFGEGLDELLRRNAHKLHGVVNGIDYEIFDPATDPLIPHHYSANDPGGKIHDKAALRSVLGLEPGPAPLIALISRLYDQKGLDLIEQALPALLRLGVQVAILGTGERRYEDLFRYHADQNPGRVSASIGFDTHLAQLLYAGSDMLLMASRSEPCGLGQLIAMRYGSIPIVRATGGLVDTVRDFDPASGQGYGFVFKEYDPWSLFAAVVRAVETYRHGAVWEGLIRTAMTQDVSWQQSASRYVQLYRTAIVGHRDRRGVFPEGIAR